MQPPSKGTESPEDHSLQPPSKGTESPEDHRLQPPSKGTESLEDFMTRETATSSLGDESLAYPNSWDLSTGIAEEIWQIILLYLEERYGDQNNKSIKAVAYPEDIHNLRLLITRFPEHTAAKLWHEKLTTQKVVKPRAKGKVVSNTAASAEHSYANEDSSFASTAESQIDETLCSSSSSDDAVVSSCNQAISTLTASQIFFFFRDKKLSHLPDESLHLLKTKFNEEEDQDDANILLKTVKMFGQSNTKLY